MTTKYIIIHNTHNGCYDFKYYEDHEARLKLTSITINPPKLFLFNTREEAQDFFEEYMNDVDCIDIRCRKGDEVEHMDYCTCGIIECDEDDNPILFYNKKNQIFLLEQGAQVFQPPQELKNDAKNMNLTNHIMSKCKNLSREQRKRYIELGKYCEDCNAKEPCDEEENQVLQTPPQVTPQPVMSEPVTPPQVTPQPVMSEPVTPPQVTPQPETQPQKQKKTKTIKKSKQTTE